MIVTESLCAVRLRNGGNAHGPITRIPADVEVRTLRDSELQGMMEIEWQGERYAAFVTDLDQRSTPVLESWTSRLRRFIA